MNDLLRTFPLALLMLAGCSESHVGMTDRDVALPDTGVSERDGGGCERGAMPHCITVYGPHTCGDSVSPADCIGGAWVCPVSTIPDPVCWCSAAVVRAPECTCGPSGWECPPTVCPDPSAAGTFCATNGQSCGACSDPCGFCNILQCTSHVWTRVEAPPPPPGTCTSFACGPSLRCTEGEQFCQYLLSDVVGVPNSYSCLAFPAACTSADCACFPIGDTCTDDGAGAVVHTIGGG